MFRLIESIIQTPIRFQPIGKTIKSGNVVELVEIAGDIFVQLSSGIKPFGFADTIDDENGWVSIYNQKMICRTSRFDKSLNYKPGNVLYVNNGVLTLNRNHYPVGHVISYFGGKNSSIELNWL